MDEQIKDGGLLPSAWPGLSGSPNSASIHSQEDMTLRDRFALRVLPTIYSTAMTDAANGSGLFMYPEWRDGLAMDVYAMADAMLKARAK